MMQTQASSHAEDYLLKIYIPFVSKATEEKLKISICTHDWGHSQNENPLLVGADLITLDREDPAFLEKPKR